MDGQVGPPETSATFGRYVLREKLGAGGMAEVFYAEQIGEHGFRKEVAIKRILPNCANDQAFILALIDEARIGGSLNHPNIVHTLEFSRANDTYFLAMEFVDGLTLAQLLRHRRNLGQRLPLPIVLEIGRQLCDGLAYAHAARDTAGRPLEMVHRDLKPANILMSRFGIVKISDFGVAKAASNLQRTGTGEFVVKGTLSYMSPEQASSATLDFRSDLYSLGAMLFEMLTLELLYPQAHGLPGLWLVTQGRIGDRLKLLEAYPPSLVAVVARLLATDREDRFRSAAEVRRALLSVPVNVPCSQDLAEIIQEAIDQGARDKLPNRRVEALKPASGSGEQVPEAPTADEQQTTRPPSRKGAGAFVPSELDADAFRDESLEAAIGARGALEAAAGARGALEVESDSRGTLEATPAPAVHLPGTEPGLRLTREGPDRERRSDPVPSAAVVSAPIPPGVGTKSSDPPARRDTIESFFQAAPPAPPVASGGLAPSEVDVPVFQTAPPLPPVASRDPARITAPAVSSFRAVPAPSPRTPSPSGTQDTPAAPSAASAPKRAPVPAPPSPAAPAPAVAPPLARPADRPLEPVDTAPAPLQTALSRPGERAWNPPGPRAAILSLTAVAALMAGIWWNRSTESSIASGTASRLETTSEHPPVPATSSDSLEQPPRPMTEPHPAAGMGEGQATAGVQTADTGDGAAASITGATSDQVPATTENGVATDSSLKVQPDVKSAATGGSSSNTSASNVPVTSSSAGTSNAAGTPGTAGKSGASSATSTSGVPRSGPITPRQDAPSNTSGGVATAKGGEKGRQRPDQGTQAAQRQGFLTVSAYPWARVLVDGKEMGLVTPLKEEPLDAGHHQLVFRNEDGEEVRREVDIKPGETVTLPGIRFDAARR